MTLKPARSTAKIYQLKIHLVDISPMVWRRLLIHEDTSIAKLHGIIQITMGWGNEHLHAFKIYGKEYGIGYSGGMMFSDNPTKIFLKDFKFRRNEKFFYEYNFNIDWKHQIRVEKITKIEDGKFYPRCIGGKNACPPEETRSLLGFQAILDLYRYPIIDFLKIVKFQEQLGYAWRPDIFNRKIINSILKKGSYDAIDQFDQIVSLHESPYYEDKYWFKKDEFQGLKKMKERLDSWGIEIEIKPDDDWLSFENTGLKVYYTFLKEIIRSKPSEEGPLTKKEQEYLDSINEILQKI